MYNILLVSETNIAYLQPSTFISTDSLLYILYISTDLFTISTQYILLIPREGRAGDAFVCRGGGGGVFLKTSWTTS